MGGTSCAIAGVPPAVLQFLRRHEEEEAQHLKQFELLLGVNSHGKTALPRMPSQWQVLAVHLYGYETLGLEFARLLVGLRPDLTSILEDEEAMWVISSTKSVPFLFREGLLLTVRDRRLSPGGAGCLARSIVISMMRASRRFVMSFSDIFSAWSMSVF